MLVGYKLFFGLLGFSSIVIEIATLIERGRFRPVNFFSYFTIEANVLVVVVFLLSALATVKGGRQVALVAPRGATTVYILLVGIGFALLLSGLKNAQLTAVPWDNTVLHYIIPVAVAVDWFVDKPTVRLSFRRALLWLLFPLVYVGYSLVRGAITGWYPYPFLNPSNKGYGYVFLIALGLLVLSLGLISIVTKLSGAKRAS